MTPQHIDAPDLDLTVLCCTYNRRADLREMVTSTLEQRGHGLRYEVLVVDNNSTDGTRDEIEQLIAAGHTNLRYLFEPRQGKSYALNTGLAAMRGRHHAVIDDDEVLPPGYLATLQRLMAAHPDACCIGGKVLPLWSEPPPTWLTRGHWSPIAILDYGEAPLRIDRNRPLCLLAGVFRTEDALAAGGYDPAVGLTSTSIGSIEDSDLLLRLYTRGKFAMYSPELRLWHKIPAYRLTKTYHRRWHLGNGHHLAIQQSPDFEASRRPVAGIPGHLIRSTAMAACRWAGLLLSGRTDQAFEAETELHFFAGFVRARLGVGQASGAPSAPATVLMRRTGGVTGRHRGPATIARG